VETSSDGSSPQHGDSIWKSLPDLPNEFSRAVFLSNCLLGLGGRNSLTTALTSCYLMHICHIHTPGSVLPTCRSKYVLWLSPVVVNLYWLVGRHEIAIHCQPFTRVP